jgi:excisionase family DNA binding protein
MIKWLSIPEYSKMTGLSRANINKLIDEGNIIATETEGGGQIRIKYEENSEFLELKKELKYQRELLERLSKHLGLNINKNLGEYNE